ISKRDWSSDVCSSDVHFTWSGGRDSLIRNASMAFNKLVSWQSNHDRRSSKSSDKLCTLLLVRRFSFYTIKCLYSLKILFSLVLTFHYCILRENKLGYSYNTENY